MHSYYWKVFVDRWNKENLRRWLCLSDHFYQRNDFASCLRFANSRRRKSLLGRLWLQMWQYGRGIFWLHFSRMGMNRNTQSICCTPDADFSQLSWFDLNYGINLILTITRTVAEAAWNEVPWLKIHSFYDAESECNSRVSQFYETIYWHKEPCTEFSQSSLRWQLYFSGRKWSTGVFYVGLLSGIDKLRSCEYLNTCCEFC